MNISSRSNMKFVKYQGQHRLSQIYLKQFGYKSNGRWYISVWYKGDNHTDILLISDFTNETNVFDMPFYEEELKRFFEDFSNQHLENHYEKIVKSIANNNFIPKLKNLLFAFVANIICRSIPHRDFFNTLLLDTQTRQIFLQEITKFEEDEYSKWKAALKELEPEYQFNVVVLQIMMYLTKVFETFDCVILKAPEDKGWFTSDNPVVIDKQENFSYLIPPEAEIYFPLSKDYCLFMFSEQSEIKNNALRKLRKNKINLVDDITHKSICDKITWNDNRYLVFFADVPVTSFE